MASRRNRRSTTLLVVLLLGAFTIVALSSSGTGGSLTSGLRSVGSTILSPFVSVVNGVTKPIGHFFEGAFNYGSVTAENQKLRAQNAKLRESGQVQSFERRQLEQIAALKGLPFVGSIPTVVGQSIALDASNFAATIQINKGRDQGINVGMPVVGAGGLVGQVVIAQKHTATIRLITDGRTRVGGSVGVNSSVLGMVAGNSSTKPLSLNFVPPSSPVTPGQIVYTNGLQGGEYPAGIPIGKVISASTLTNSGQMAITLKPMANLDSLAYVEVLLWSPPL